MSSRNFERWVSKLGIDERMTHSDEDFWALCPCHSDTKPSLHVYIGAKGNIVMNCFVCGAKGKDVCKRVGAPLNWLDADPKIPDEWPEMPLKDPGSINHLVIEQMARKNGKAYTWKDIRCAVLWNESFDVAADAICMMAERIAGRRDTVSDELVRALVSAYADRLGSKVMLMLDEEVAASTPEESK